MNIGIDIGGSHIAIGLVEKDEILEKREIQIYEKNKIEQFIEETIVSNINNLLREKNIYLSDIKKIGIATPGTVEDGQIIKNAVNLGIQEYNICKALKKYYPNTEIQVKNDAKCAAMAEKLYGNMKEYKSSLFICLGTGVGGALFINGKLFEPQKYSGLEIGHMSIKQSGEKCKCGKVGCFDIYGSMKNFKAKLTQSLGMPQNAISYEILPKLEGKITDEIQKIINEYVENLAIGISNLINIFEPEITVIGGSFTYYQSILLEPLKEKIIKEKLLFNKRENINIVAAKLFNDAGIIGAGNL